jgi:hypothetical protein
MMLDDAEECQLSGPIGELVPYSCREYLRRRAGRWSASPTPNSVTSPSRPRPPEEGIGASGLSLSAAATSGEHDELLESVLAVLAPETGAGTSHASGVRTHRETRVSSSQSHHSPIPSPVRALSSMRRAVGLTLAGW